MSRDIDVSFVFLDKFLGINHGSMGSYRQWLAYCRWDIHLSFNDWKILNRLEVLESKMVEAWKAINELIRK